MAFTAPTARDYLPERARGWRSAWARYGVAVLAVGFALGVQKAFSWLFPDEAFPFTVFFPAVVVAGWFGRFGPALAATALSLVAASWCAFTQPAGFALTNPAHLVAIATDVLVALSLAVAIEGMHRANDRAMRRLAERRQADEALRESQEVFAKAFRASPDGLVISRVKDGLVYEVNDSWLRLFGLERAQAVGRTSDELQFFADPADRLRAVDHLMNEGRLREFPVNIVVAGGELRPALLAAESIDVRGEPCLLTIIRDVSAQTRAEQEVRESAERIRLVTAATGVTLFQQDTALRYMWVHNPFQGYAAEDILGLTDEQIGPSLDEVDALIAAKRSVMATGRGTRLEVVNHSPNGRRVVYESVLEPLVDAAGRTVGLLGAAVDVTLRREADARLRAREEQLRVVTDHAAVMIVQCDAAGRYTFANLPFAARYGLRPEEIIGRPMIDVLGPEAHAALAPHLAATLRGERVEFEAFLPYPTIASRWTHCIWVPQKDAAGVVTGFVAVIQDITVRKAVEAALRESEERFRSMADGLPLLVWVHDAAGEQEFVNRTFCEFFGVSLAEMKGARWRALLHAEDEARYSQDFLTAVQTRGTFHGEARVRRQDGEWCWIESWARPRLSPAGEFLGMVGASVDVSERKRAERLLAAARDEAVDANRAKDDFIALLSHELRTPLSPALLLAGEAANDAALPELVRRDFETIAQSIALEARLIDDLLDLNRIVRGKLALEREALDVHEVLRDAGRGVQEDAQAKPVTLEFALDARYSSVTGDPVRLRQVFWNVLKNAVKFTPGGGRVVIATTNDAPGREIEVQIRDTGIGMAPEELARAFEPFAQGAHARRGENRYGGLGLGLTIARTLIERHAGRIHAESAGPGTGTTVRIQLPTNALTLHEPPATFPAVREAVAQPTTPTPGASVLLVEDHAPTRRALATLLRRRGCRVAVAGSLAEARRCAASDAFEVVISDLGLPDGDGCTLMAELHATGAAPRGIAMTGFGMEADVARSRAAGFAEHLTKPVTMASVDRALARVLAPPP